MLGRTGELVTVIQRLSLARSVPEIQAIVRTAARQLTGADGATFVLSEQRLCYYADEDAISPLWKGQRFPPETCMSGWVMKHRRAVAIEDIFTDPASPMTSTGATFVRSMAMVPIRRLDPLGAIGNYWATPHRATVEELELLQALADTTAVAMENVRFYEQLRDSQLETLQRLALVAEYRDDNTYQHTERVARTAYLLAERLGPLPPGGRRHPPGGAAARRRQAGRARRGAAQARTADRGRVRADQAPHARSAARSWPAATSSCCAAGRRSPAATMSAGMEADTPAGWPARTIPLSARIVALADIFDALTHARCYKAAWDTERAIEEILRLRGHQLDPDVVDAFADLDSPSLVELPEDWAPVLGQRPLGP